MAVYWQDRLHNDFTINSMPTSLFYVYLSAVSVIGNSALQRKIETYGRVSFCGHCVICLATPSLHLVLHVLALLFLHPCTFMLVCVLLCTIVHHCHFCKPYSQGSAANKHVIIAASAMCQGWRQGGNEARGLSSFVTDSWGTEPPLRSSASLHRTLVFPDTAVENVEVQTRSVVHL